MGLPPVRRFLAHARGSRPIVASDRAFAPVPPDAPGEPVQTGALFLPPAAPLDDAVEAFLRAGPAPVYVGFGSMPDEAPGGTSRTIADGLRGTDGVAAAAAELLERTPPPATRQSLGP
jgi:vancomycin aglycone glucosyltransferase